MRHFRRLRRATAVLAHLLVASLAFTSGMTQCPLAGSVSVAAGHSMGHAGGSHRHGTPSPAHDHRSDTRCDDVACATPSCASTHCATSATSSTSVATTLTRVGRVVIADEDDAPRYTNAAPEPPPPRA